MPSLPPKTWWMAPLGSCVRMAKGPPKASSVVGAEPSVDAAKALGKVTPELNGKVIGMAFRVPIPKVSATDLPCPLDKTAKCVDTNKAVKQALEGNLRGILDRPRTRLSFQTLMMTRTLRTSMPGLALSSLTIWSSSFPGMKMNFVTETGWRIRVSTWPPGGRAP